MTSGPAPEPWVLGADLGGTSTRVLLADGRGSVLAAGRAGAANLVTDPAGAARSLSAALSDALSDAGSRAGSDAGSDAPPRAPSGPPVRPTGPRDVADRVRAAVVAVAGSSALDQPRVRQQLTAAVRTALPGCRVRLVDDLEAAFTSGTPAPDGTVLVAGTGAVAGLVRGHRLSRVAGGWGWLLGDDGAGFWLGRQAVRVALRALDAGARPADLAPDGLAALVLTEVLTTAPASAADARGRLVRAFVGDPAALAALAPLVSRAHDDGDLDARTIVAAAADELLALLVPLTGSAPPPGPLVLAGSVLAGGTPVSRAVRSRLAAAGQQPVAGPVLASGSAAGAAAWSALAMLDPALADDRTHHRLTRSAV